MKFYFILFFEKNDDGGLFLFLKMNEPWANAPSLEHKSVNLEKNLI